MAQYIKDLDPACHTGAVPPTQVPWCPRSLLCLQVVVVGCHGCGGLVVVVSKRPEPQKGLLAEHGDLSKYSF